MRESNLSKLVTGSKVRLDLLQLKSGHLENLDFTRLFFVLHYLGSSTTLRCNDERKS